MSHATSSNMTKLAELHREFTKLRAELFPNGALFVQYDEDDPRWERYDALLGLFHPALRKEGWKDPRKQ